MTPDRREILEQVARGELTPEDADELLRDLDREPSPRSDSGVRQGIRKIRVSVGVGGIDIIGDPEVVTAEIDGPHEAEIDGDTMVIHGELDPHRPRAFAISTGGHRRRGRGIRIGPGIVAFGDKHVSRLRIRINPSLELDTTLDAGPLSIRDVKGPIRARVAAGPISIDEFEGPLDVSVNAGAIRAVGKLVAGESRVRSDAGAVRIELDPASNVHIVGHAALGKVIVLGDDGHTKKGRFGSDRREATLGEGEATLRVETAMGSVHVSVR
jgi:hypothetical protein